MREPLITDISPEEFVAEAEAKLPKLPPTVAALNVERARQLSIAVYGRRRSPVPIALDQRISSLEAKYGSTNG